MSIGEAAFGLGSSAATAVVNNWQANKQRRWASNEAQIARDYNTTMDNTKVQRSVQDYEAAGLNKILALGSTASSAPSAPLPSGAMAGQADFSSNTSALQMGAQNKLLKAQARDVNTAADLKAIEAQTKGLQNIADLDKTLAEIDRTISETNVNNERKENLIEERQNLKAMRNQIIANIANIKTSTQLTSAKQKTEKEIAQNVHIDRTLKEKDLARAKREESFERNPVTGTFRGITRTLGGIFRPR